MTKFIHPCPGTTLTSKFGYRNDPINGTKSWHQGVDFAKGGNVPILASADGVVKQYISDKTSYGNVIFIQHTINGKRFDTTYAHLKSKLVKDGDKVKQGQIIGYMGNTGRSSGQHLHFEIHNGSWKTGQPNAVDPMLYINKEDEEEVKLYNELKKQLDDLKKEVAELKKINDALKANEKASVDEWAKQASEWVKKTEISDGTRPKVNITRQEVFVLLNRLFNLIKTGKVK